MRGCRCRGGVSATGTALDIRPACMAGGTSHDARIRLTSHSCFNNVRLFLFFLCVNVYFSPQCVRIL